MSRGGAAARREDVEQIGFIYCSAVNGRNYQKTGLDISTHFSVKEFLAENAEIAEVRQREKGA